jgi:hypothetical protein
MWFVVYSLRYRDQDLSFIRNGGQACLPVVKFGPYFLLFAFCYATIPTA